MCLTQQSEKKEKDLKFKDFLRTQWSVAYGHINYVLDGRIHNSTFLSVTFTPIQAPWSLQPKLAITIYHLRPEKLLLMAL